MFRKALWVAFMILMIWKHITVSKHSLRTENEEKNRRKSKTKGSHKTLKGAKEEIKLYNVIYVDYSTLLES